VLDNQPTISPSPDHGKPHFPPGKFEDKAFRVVCDTYVEATSGTGIVHQAPAFGEDDHRIAIQNGIVAKDEMPPCPIDEVGRFTSEVPDFKGVHVKVCMLGLCSDDREWSADI
jgi:isoleucyl-tRNA synthetase